MESKNKRITKLPQGISLLKKENQVLIFNGTVP